MSSGGKPRFTTSNRGLMLFASAALWLLYADLLVSVPGCTDAEGDDPSTDAAFIDGATSFDAAPVFDAAPLLDAPPLADAANDDAGLDATADATADATLDASTDGAPSDGASSDSAPPSDGAADALGALDAPADAPKDAAAAQEELVSPAKCPWGIAIAGNAIFWTETPNGAGCGAPSVRSCSTVTPCATLPTPLYTAINQSLPTGIAAVTAAGPIFYADNQAPNNHLWRLEVDGGRTAWGSSQAGPAAVVQDLTHVYWGHGSGMTRVTVPSANELTVFTGNMAGSIDNGPQTIALDTSRVFGAIDTNKIRVCDKTGNCNDGGSTLVGADVADAGPAEIGAVASDGTHVFFTSGMAYYTTSGVERLLRCPVAGCPGGVPELLHERSTNVAGPKGSHFGIAVDSANVYFGTIAGTIEYCAKGAAAPCTPKVLVANARPFGFAQDGAYLYWGDWRGGIYRILRP